MFLFLLSACVFSGQEFISSLSGKQTLFCAEFFSFHPCAAECNSFIFSTKPCQSNPSKVLTQEPSDRHSRTYISNHTHALLSSTRSLMTRKPSAGTSGLILLLADDPCCVFRLLLGYRGCRGGPDRRGNEMASANGYQEKSFKASGARCNDCKQLSHKEENASSPQNLLILPSHETSWNRVID